MFIYVSPSSTLVHQVIACHCEGLLIATASTNVVTCTSAIDGCSDRWVMAMHFLGRMCRVDMGIVMDYQGIIIG